MVKSTITLSVEAPEKLKAEKVAMLQSENIIGDLVTNDPDITNEANITKISIK